MDSVRALTVAEIMELFRIWREAPPVPDLMQIGFGIRLDPPAEERPSEPLPTTFEEFRDLPSAAPDEYASEEQIRSILARSVRG